VGVDIARMAVARECGCRETVLGPRTQGFWTHMTLQPNVSVPLASMLTVTMASFLFFGHEDFAVTQRAPQNFIP
jgi:hypothetical protein